MEIAIIIFGLLSIGCTWMIFMTISVFNKKIAEMHKVIANLHITSMNIQSKIKSIEEKEKKKKPVVYDKSGKIREIVYKVPREIKGNLNMNHNGTFASVDATFKVKETK